MTCIRNRGWDRLVERWILNFPFGVDVDVRRSQYRRMKARETNILRVAPPLELLWCYADGSTGNNVACCAGKRERTARLGEISLFFPEGSITAGVFLFVRSSSSRCLPGSTPRGSHRQRYGNEWPVVQDMEEWGAKHVGVRYICSKQSWQRVAFSNAHTYGRISRFCASARSSWRQGR